MNETPATVLLDRFGAPARKPDDGACPGKDGRRCGAAREKRVLSAGFGAPHDVCGVCGYEWDERTL